MAGASEAPGWTGDGSGTSCYALGADRHQSATRSGSNLVPLVSGPASRARQKLIAPTTAAVSGTWNSVAIGIRMVIKSPAWKGWLP
jgi:hypothetical protein